MHTMITEIYCIFDRKQHEKMYLLYGEILGAAIAL